MNPLVSICVPSYNHQKFVREAVESVLNQTYTNFELIIIDDCSTDNSVVNIIQSYKDPRIKFYQNEVNMGGYKTLNKAVKLAKGDLIAILHTDDEYDNHFLEEIIKAYNKYPDHKVFVTGMYNKDSTLGHITPIYPFNSEGVISRKEILIRLAYENNIGNGINVVINKDVLGKDDFYDPNYTISSDLDLFMRLAENYDFVYINKLLTYYRMHESNLTNRVFLEMIKQGHEVCNKHLSKSKIISKDLLSKLFRLHYKNMINKAFYIGFKYNSRALTQDILNFFRNTYPELRYNYYWHLMYFSSFFINNLSSKLLTKSLFKLGKYYRAYICWNVAKLSS